MGFFDRWFGKKSAPEARAEPALSPREYFARELEQLIVERAGTKVLRGADEFTLLVSFEGRESTVFLGNVFEDTREVSPERRVEIIQRFISSLMEPVPTFGSLEEARPSLAVSLRGGFSEEKSGRLVAREFLPCLREYVVIDGADRIMFCTEESAAGWKTSTEELLRLGREHVAEAGVRLSCDARGVFSVDNGDDYEATRLVLPGFLASFSDKVKGRPIAVVPSRNQLYVAGDADPEIVISLCELAEREYAASPRRVSAAIYSVDEAGNVVRYVRDVNDDAALRAKLAHVRFEGSEYSRQREVLSGQNNGVFVASFSAMTSKEGLSLSFAAAPRGQQTWLPRTDLVGLLGEGSSPVMIPWAEIMRVAPGRLTPVPDVFPPRWQTQADFSEDELTRMKPLPLG